jgi:CubicO group peptidase (beta-lactamase class C family)
MLTFRRAARWLPLVSIALVARTGAASPTTLTPQKAAAVDGAVKAEIVRQNLVGAAVGVIDNGNIVYLQGYGWADREHRVPVDRRTMFRWASISKPVTAVAAAQLAQAGKLDLDADVRSYVPEFPDKGKTITTAEVLSHQSGIPGYATNVIPLQKEYDSPHPFEDVVTALDTFSSAPLLFDPGTKYAYTTHGFILASAVVQRAGKAPFARQVEDRIAGPLGMTTFQPDYQWKDIPHRAVGYRKRDGQTVLSTNTDVSWKLGGGGYISTIGDLARFAQGLINHRLVNRRMETLMWTPRALSTGAKTGYGLGFAVRDDETGLTVSHGGGQEKTASLMWLRPNERRGIVVFANVEGAGVEAIKNAVDTALQSTNG